MEKSSPVQPAQYQVTVRLREKKSTILCITLQNGVENSFAWLYCRIKNGLLEVIQKYPVLNAMCYPSYEQLSGAEDTITSINSSKTQWAKSVALEEFRSSLTLSAALISDSRSILRSFPIFTFSSLSLRGFLKLRGN